MHHTYNEEKVSTKKSELLKAIDLRDKIHKWEITHEEAKKLLNNPLILISWINFKNE